MRRRSVLLLALAGCAGRTPPPAAPGEKRNYPGRLVPTEQMGRPFLVRQRLTSEHRGRALPGLDAVLQLHGGSLRLVGLGPMGTRAFVIEQKGVEIEAQNHLGKAVPLEPRDVLNDIHRVFFRGLFVGQPPPADGEHRGQDDGEAVVERWQNRRLLRRTFTRAAAELPGAIEIEFRGDGPVIAREVVLRNGWFGYTLTIETQEQQWLAGA